MPSRTADPATSRSSPATVRSEERGSIPAADPGRLRVAAMARTPRAAGWGFLPRPTVAAGATPDAVAEVPHPQGTADPARVRPDPATTACTARRDVRATVL